MKLAEALSLRANAVRRIEQLRSRIVSNARFQEGEEPAEDAVALLAEAGEVLSEYEMLIRRINRTNAATEIGADDTLTDALARRDALRLRHSVLTAAADAAAGTNQPGYARQLRSELKMLSALPVAELRARADDVAREPVSSMCESNAPTGRWNCWIEGKRGGAGSCRGGVYEPLTSGLSRSPGARRAVLRVRLPLTAQPSIAHK
jgi:hypothetical protein